MYVVSVSMVRSCMYCWHVIRERLMFIGTQISNLYTAVDTPAKAALAKLVSKDLRRKHMRPGSPLESQGLYIQDINLLHLPTLRHPRDHYYTHPGHSPLMVSPFMTTQRSEKDYWFVFPPSRLQLQMTRAMPLHRNATTTALARFPVHHSPSSIGVF